MNIRKWLGLVTAVSPYSLPPGASAEQNNLQVRDGQLKPRPGMSPLGITNTSTVIALHRQSLGGNQADRIFAFTLADSNAGVQSYSLFVAEPTGGPQLNTTPITSIETSATLVFPSFAQDRHGSVYVFYGHGILPQTIRYGVPASPLFSAERFGMPAPTVAPQVTPSGNGWFLERVDVLQSGGSYWHPPELTVSGGSPDRNATLRAVVQAGAIVGVEVVDGGSNFKDVPTITVGAAQIGTGFLGTGILGVSAPVYGFFDTTAVANGYPSGGPFNTANTHANAQSQIAYKSGNNTLFAATTFNAISGEYSALIPLTAGKTNGTSNGTGAFAEVKFSPRSTAFKLGDAAINYQTGVSTEATTVTGPTTGRFRFRRESWQAADDYYENTYSPPNAGYTPASKWKYHHATNKDGFWGVLPNPNLRKFAKRQLAREWWVSGSTFSSGRTERRYADYFFPDYGRIGYRILAGPENALNVESNWIVGSAPVQFSGGLPYIDITLSTPARDAQGLPRPTNANTVWPIVRIYLSLCPDAWTVDNVAPLQSGQVYHRRFTPQSGQDRRIDLTDTSNGQSSSDPSGLNVVYSYYNLPSATLTSLDTRKRWYGPGFVNNSNPQQAIARPIVDTRVATTGSPGTAASTVEILNAGAQLAQGTKFAIRLEQYNAADYRTANETESTSGLYNWLTQFPSQAIQSATAADFQRRGTFGQTYLDLYFEANAIDTAGGDPALLLPGAVKSPPAPKVVLSGSGWGAGEYGEFTLQQRDPAGTTYSESVTYRFETVEITPAIAGARIVSVNIISGGQNYYREPTILFKGGGGYGLRLQSAVANGRVTSAVIADGGDGFTSDTTLYTDVQPAKLYPVMRGTMRGNYRCAYRFADYRRTVANQTAITFTNGSKFATLASTEGVQPGMQITGTPGLWHLVRIVSITGNQVTLSRAAFSSGTAVPCTVRDMTRPITYSDFSPITDVEAVVDGSSRAARMDWAVVGATAPPRADYVEFFRTSADQSLVFYRLDVIGVVIGGVIHLFNFDTLSDEELFDIDRPTYAALPVVLPNGGLNAYRFGTARNDMAVCVAWEDRLWYGVSTSGNDSNTVFFSELDEFESCPDLNELPIQANLRASDYLTALVPFGPVLLAMQAAHCYSVSYNTDPAVDPVITLAAHRGCLNQRTWDIFDDLLYAADERGVYAMSRTGEVKALSEPIRNLFSEIGRLDFFKREAYHLRVDQVTGILRLFVTLGAADSYFPQLALCYHIRNETWWTESWPNSLICSGDYRPFSKSRERPIYGALNGGIYEFAGLQDYPYGDIVSVTVTNGGSGYKVPPSVTLTSAGRGAELRALLVDGVVTEVLILRAGFGYGSRPASDDVFNPVVPLVFSAPPSGVTATGFATARDINQGTEEAPIIPKTSVPFSIRTGAMALAYEGSGRNGDRQMDRSITVTYRPTTGPKTLLLREYYNNSPSPRPNVMRRDRGTGFVHQTDGAKTTLDMDAQKSPLGTSTGLAKAMFAGRSLDDIASADRHIAVELACDALDATNAVPPEPLIYELEIRGVTDGSE
jgi:hypothetical protein